MKTYDRDDETRMRDMRRAWWYSRRAERKRARQHARAIKQIILFSVAFFVTLAAFAALA